MKSLIDNLFSSILAGFAISIGCIANLIIGGTLGAVLFSFGLLTIIYFNWNLYTGRAGYITDFGDILNLLVIYIGNILGCAVSYYVITTTKTFDVQPILDVRISYNWIQTLVLSIYCGFIMTAAVDSTRQGHFIILLIGIPLFILCGFLHSIADFFYYMFDTSYLTNNSNYWISVLGNLVGCNLWRLRLFRNYI